MVNKDLGKDLAEVKIEGKIRDVTTTNPITSSQAWMEVSDVMSKNVATITPDQSVYTAARVMSERNISCILVAENKNIIGIVTETDLLKKVAAQGEDFYDMPVSTIMSSSVAGVSLETSVLAASQTMQAKHIKRLPVFAGEKLVGIVTQTDLTRALTHYGTWRDVAEIMSLNVCEIQRGSSVSVASRVMALSKISSILVRSNDEVVGILTQRDIFNKVVALKRDPLQVKVEEIMSSRVISVPRSYSVFSASKTMAELKIRRLVVMEDNRVFGIVTQTDIFNAIKNKLATEEEKHLKLLNESKSCIFATDLQGTVTYVNTAFARLFEATDRETFINQPILPHRLWANPRKRRQFIERFNQWSFESDELTLKTTLGNRKYVTVFSSFTTGAHGEINGREGIIYDSTERRLSEKKQAELLRQLEKTNGELEDFARTVERDLHGPLQDIETLLQEILAQQGSKLDEPGRDQLSRLASRVGQMRNLIDSFEQQTGVGFVVDD